MSRTDNTLKMTTPVERFNKHIKAEKAFAVASIIVGVAAVYRGIQLYKFAKNLKLKANS